MSRNDFIVRIAAAVVGIVAIALAAATISSPIEPGGSGGVGPGDGNGGFPESPPAEEPASGGEIPAFLEYLLYVLVAIAALALAWYLIVHRRDIVKLIAVFLAVGLLVSVLAFGLMQFAESGGEIPLQNPADEPANESGGGDGFGEGEQESQPISVEPLLVVLTIAAVIFVGALALSGRGTEESTDPPIVEAEPEPDQTAAVGTAAGRAAERIEEADDVDNEVYRAWREMTTLLEVDSPETSTPGEFEAAAIESGLAPEHVGELTRLFEDVRYGDEEITDSVASRAIAVLRLIESEYADDASNGAEAGPSHSSDWRGVDE